MHELYLTYALVGVVGVLLALVSTSVRRSPISEPLVALAIGILVGPEVFGLIDISNESRDTLLLEGTRLLLAFSVMAAALRFPARALRPSIPALIVLLAVVMPLAAAVAAAAGLLLGLPLALAATVGACLAPTDPVLAASVVTGGPAESNLPARLRQLLTAESGANDGLGLPLVGLGLAAALSDKTAGSAALHLAYEVLGGTLLGVVVGLTAGVGVSRALGRGAFGHGPQLVFTLLLAVGVLGLSRLVKLDGVLAVFVAGLAYNRRVAGSEREPQDSIDEAVNRYAILPLFLLLGVVLPWSDWIDFGPLALLFVVLVLVVRRLPFLLLLRRPLGLSRSDAGFAGWFGPMGVSAIFYLAYSLHEGVDDPRLFAAGSLVVVASVVAFALSAGPATRAYPRFGARSTASPAR